MDVSSSIVATERLSAHYVKASPMKTKRSSRLALLTLASSLYAIEASAQVPAPSAPAAVAPYYIGPGYVPPPPPVPPVRLGINMQAVYIPGAGAETGLRVTNVWPGYPAFGLLDPGDIITRVNGRRVRSVPEFQNAMAYAGPYVNLRLWNVRTGYIHDIAPIYLGDFGPGAAAAAPAAAAPAPTAAP